MTTIMLVIETNDTPLDPNDKFTFPAPRGLAVAPVVPAHIRAIVAQTTFSDRVELLRGKETEAEGID